MKTMNELDMQGRALLQIASELNNAKNLAKNYCHLDNRKTFCKLITKLLDNIDCFNDSYNVDYLDVITIRDAKAWWHTQVASIEQLQDKSDIQQILINSYNYIEMMFHTLVKYINSQFLNYCES